MKSTVSPVGFRQLYQDISTNFQMNRWFSRVGDEGILEEIGWTGFASPRLLASQRLPIAGLWLGLVWALWHVLVDFRYNFNTMGIAWLVQFAIFYIVTLTAYRLLMTWVYANTQSLLLAVLMHAAYTGWLFVLFPATSFEQSMMWQTVFALSLGAVGLAASLPLFGHRAGRLRLMDGSLKQGKSS